MDNDEVVTTEVVDDVKDQLAKLLLGTAAGFIAGKVVEGIYDHFKAKRHNRTETAE